MSDVLTVKFFRFDPEKDKQARLENFEIPFDQEIRVIDVIHYIQENYDGTVAFRANCRAGRCGSDAVEVDGIPVLACKHKIRKGTKEISISPLKAFPVIKDLVVDFSKAFEYAKDIQNFTPDPNEKGFWKIKQEDVQEIRELRKCIECFMCHDVCHVITEHQKKFVGPRFVVKATALDKHPKDTFKQRYKSLEEKGIWQCNVSRCCQVVCPEKIRITDDAIIFAKERSVDDHSFLKKSGRK